MGHYSHDPRTSRPHAGTKKPRSVSRTSGSKVRRAGHGKLDYSVSNTDEAVRFSRRGTKDA